ncbi:MATE family efflux transporter [Salidesulfovibrio brasiliensis]|uniref:MATE family efflux transporter n=1 Tax=Salidesulfovibrio brasiliensis TaxID=221711 RepID=UPI0034E1EDAC
MTAQSLVGYFMGRADTDSARSVARLTCYWSLATGTALCLFMIVFRDAVAWLLVPAGAMAAFHPGWLTAAFMQPVSSLAFATDGIHWGAGDFRYLRNAMVAAVFCGSAAVLAVEWLMPQPVLVWIWLAATLWTSVRAGFGIARIWPGIGHAPLWRDTEGLTD